MRHIPTLHERRKSSLVEHWIKAGEDRMGMEEGKVYIVTKASNDKTFRVGDHIHMDIDGSIICRETQGWIEACYVAETTEGMEFEIDQMLMEGRNG
jgi:hypothetical protein